MKIEAIVEFPQPLGDCEVGDSIHVDVDTDYVESNADAVNEWVRNELESTFMRPFSNEDFTVTNMDAILEDLAFDEFKDKTQYANI